MRTRVGWWRAGAAGAVALAACSSGSSPGAPAATTVVTAPATAPPASSPPTTGAPVPPVTATWRALPPSPIANGRAVWTGAEVIVWGPADQGATTVPVDPGTAVAAAAAYDPSTGSWRSLPPSPAGVSGDPGEAAVWTGRTAVFWTANFPVGPEGGVAYDPVTDSWRRLPAGPLGIREGYSTAWTGEELLIVGGYGGKRLAAPVGAALDPAAGSWRVLHGLDQFGGLLAGGIVWDGRQAFIAGLVQLCPELGSGCADNRPVLIAYDPVADTAREMDFSPSPFGPDAPFGVIGWTGSRALLAIAHGVLAEYDPEADRWTATPDRPCPPVTTGAQPTLAGRLWLDPCGDGRLAAYDLDTSAWLVIEQVGPSPLVGTSGSIIAWTGSELFVWGGRLRQTGNPPTDSAAALRLTLR